MADELPSIAEYRLLLQARQSQRLRHDHADLAAEPQYRQLAEFFFEELYGPQDFSSRDAQARRLHQFVHMAPGLAVRDIELVLELLELTYALDEAVVLKLAALQAPHDFSETVYEQAYRTADNYTERAHQIELVKQALYNVYRLSKKPLLGIALSRTGGIAQAVGMADIHRFLRVGYEAIQSVRDVHRFVETVGTRELSRLNRIYGR